ncbi:hypothetical protein VCSRO86_2190 [Vibrio cholerae]|nr:hypothetical protein VCSRO86_2190 [Vibrio cholerae]
MNGGQIGNVDLVKHSSFGVQKQQKIQLKLLNNINKNSLFVV